ncbi:hypothetical protein FHR81_000889 [Actinoalloteichus hoggarensis]|uniref:hypothetical protein n=1 Tax=Actinoalloteichus hoggarensis TaxID=1470176 RepID=UPI000B8B1B83|nr:hypothetical protein [Actinoalloteichus hoggarensis]MBB5919860.1 hypothetical protein [Actinoalloteichus hoggarensis]
MDHGTRTFSSPPGRRLDLTEAAPGRSRRMRGRAAQPFDGSPRLSIAVRAFVGTGRRADRGGGLLHEIPSHAL